MLKFSEQHNICFTSPEDTPGLLDLYFPIGNTAFPLLVFFHGGGLEEGAKEDLAALAREFASCGIAVAAPNYRLYPQAAYPAFIEDAAKAISWLTEHINGYFLCKNIFIGGHSAGAYIAMMLCFDRAYLSNQGLNSEEFGGYIFCSGQPTSHFTVLKHRLEDPRKVIIDGTAPIFHIRSKGAPLQIICAGADIENRLEQTRLMVSTLKQFGYEKEVDFKILRGYDHSSYLHREGGRHSRLYEISSGFICRHSK
jgi:dipeptidyl aminopeptidase/acylaminoacyl peptidase